jgi:hypothetical protein
MPTGYTAKLYEGKPQTVQEFILTCARAFVATIEQRDESLDVPPRPREARTEYHDDALTKATKALDAASRWTDEEANQFARDQHTKALARWEANCSEQLARRRRYEDMLMQVDRWVPPTDEHQGLKDFMLDQLRESIKFDCSVYDPPAAMTGVEYRQSSIECAERDLVYHTEQRRQEIERIDGSNLWIADLYGSLSDLTVVL